MLLSIPASLGLVALRVPVITLLLQRGEFDTQSTKLVAWALLFYGIGLVGHAMVEILARAFYALHDTKTPVMIGIAAMSLNVLFSYLFSALFIRQGWMPHGGLALANTLATALEMVGLIFIMRKRLGGLNGKQVGSGLGKSLAAGGVNDSCHLGLDQPGRRLFCLASGTWGNTDRDCCIYCKFRGFQNQRAKTAVSGYKIQIKLKRTPK